MSEESDTALLEKKPLVKVIIDYCLKRLEVILIAGIIGGCNHWQHNKTVKWVGDHLADKQQQINQLKETK